MENDFFECNTIQQSLEGNTVLCLQCTKYKLGLMISSIGNLAARHDQNSKLSVILDW